MSLTFKRGDTFLLEGVVTDDGVAVDITNWTIQSQLRDRNHKLIFDLVVEKTNALQGRYLLKAAATDTDDWPTGLLDLNVQYTTDVNQVVSTKTVKVDVQLDITHA